MRVDSVFRGGSIYTLDPRHPYATQLAVVNGRVVALDDDVDDLVADEVVDLRGFTVVPGFHDAHLHTIHYGLSLNQLDLRSSRICTLAQLYQAVAERARVTPEGQWIVGAGYDQNKLGGHPHRRALDDAAPAHPVWLQHTSRHMGVVNSSVLRQIDPQRIGSAGVVQIDADGQPTGLVQEQAQILVRELLHPYPLRELVDAIDRAHRQFVREGVTSVQEAGIGGGWVGHSPAELGAYQIAKAEGRLGVRTTVMVSADVLHPLGPAASESFDCHLDLGITTGLGDNWLRIGPLKVFADGSLIGRTCAMYEPFEGEPENCGLLQHDEQSLRQTILAAHRAGWQIATHAIGDRAVDLVLDIYNEALIEFPRRNHRHRIEHAGVTSDAAVDAMAHLGVIPNPQGRFIGALGDGMAAALGPTRVKGCYRQRSFIEHGLVLPASSDRPVVDGVPLAGMHDLVNQRTDTGQSFNPQEALTISQALHAYTVGSAFAAFLEADRGTLGVGKLADFAVLSEDLLHVAPQRIRDVTVVGTAVAGRVVYDQAQLAAVEPVAKEE